MVYSYIQTLRDWESVCAVVVIKKTCSVIECFYPIYLHFVFVVAFASIMWQLWNAVHLAWIISSQELLWRVITVIKSPPRCLTLESGTSVPRCFWRTLHSSPNEFFRQNACFSKRLFSACGFSISCIMDFIVIIKKKHTYKLLVMAIQNKMMKLFPDRTQDCQLGHRNVLIFGFVFGRYLVWRNTPEIGNCRFNFVLKNETKLCWLHSWAWPSPASSFFSCCHMINRME